MIVGEHLQIAEGDFVQTLAKGLSVLTAFSRENPAMTLSDVARMAGLSKPSARRLLLTLQVLGYVSSHAGKFRLTPKVLDLGAAYLSSADLPAIVDPFLAELNDYVQEACSVGVFDGDSVVYIARAASQKRIMTFTVQVGTRIDPIISSLGKVLLAYWPEQEVLRFLDRKEQEGTLGKGIWNRQQFLENLGKIRQRGWEMVDQQVEVGVRTIAAPLFDVNGHVIAGINVAAHSTRVSVERMTDEFLPRLLETQKRINQALSGK